MQNSELLNESINVYMSALKNLEKLISQPTSEISFFLSSGLLWPLLRIVMSH